MMLLNLHLSRRSVHPGRLLPKWRLRLFRPLMMTVVTRMSMMMVVRMMMTSASFTIAATMTFAAPPALAFLVFWMMMILFLLMTLTKTNVLSFPIFHHDVPCHHYLPRPISPVPCCVSALSCPPPYQLLLCLSLLCLVLLSAVFLKYSREKLFVSSLVHFLDIRHVPGLVLASGSIRRPATGVVF